MTDPLAQINVTISCLDNVGSGTTTVSYSGRTLLMWSQFGVLESNANRQGGVLRNGIWRGDPGYCQGVRQCFGDFHQSVHSIRASAGAEKWIIGNGISLNTRDQNDDPVRGLNVWRWQGSSFRWAGNINPRLLTPPMEIAHNDNRVYISLVGDFAYTRNASHNAFIKYDLTAMTCEPWGVLPPTEQQEDIDGFTYKFEKQDVQHMRFVREGGADVAKWFCPNDKITRKQVAAMLWNAMKWQVANPGMAPPVPSTQQFEDVPITDPFRSSIDALAAANIVVGKTGPTSPCEEVEL